MIVKVLQINIAQLSDKINELGTWEAASKAYPQVAAHLKLSTLGPENYDPSMDEHFDLVHVMDVPSLESCFSVLNGMPVEGAWFIHQGRGTSLSVGDMLIVCTPEGETKHMVDMFGFAELPG